LSDNFLFQNGLKQKDTLSPLLLHFSLEYAIRKVQENQVGPELNGTHVDDVNLLGDNRYYKENLKTLSDSSKEVGLELNTEKTKYMLLSRHLNKDEDQGIKIAYRCFENMARLKIKKNNKNLSLEEIKSRSN
jgi:hypothetical protein